MKLNVLRPVTVTIAFKTPHNKIKIQRIKCFNSVNSNYVVTFDVQKCNWESQRPRPFHIPETCSMQLGIWRVLWVPQWVKGRALVGLGAKPQKCFRICSKTRLETKQMHKVLIICMLLHHLSQKLKWNCFFAILECLRRKSYL